MISLVQQTCIDNRERRSCHVSLPVEKLFLKLENAVLIRTLGGKGR
jgi:hypothetical protein